MPPFVDQLRVRVYGIIENGSAETPYIFNYSL